MDLDLLARCAEARTHVEAGELEGLHALLRHIGGVGRSVGGRLARDVGGCICGATVDGGRGGRGRRVPRRGWVRRGVALAGDAEEARVGDRRRVAAIRLLVGHARARTRTRAGHALGDGQREVEVRHGGDARWQGRLGCARSLRGDGGRGRWLGLTGRRGGGGELHEVGWGAEARVVRGGMGGLGLGELGWGSEPRVGVRVVWLVLALGGTGEGAVRLEWLALRRRLAPARELPLLAVRRRRGRRAAVRLPEASPVPTGTVRIAEGGREVAAIARGPVLSLPLLRVALALLWTRGAALVAPSLGGLVALRRALVPRLGCQLGPKFLSKKLLTCPWGGPWSRYGYGGLLDICVVREWREGGGGEREGRKVVWGCSVRSGGEGRSYDEEPGEGGGLGEVREGGEGCASSR